MTQRTRFPWQSTGDVVGDLLTIHALRADQRGRLIAGAADAPDLVVVPPAVLGSVEPGTDVAVWLEGLPDRLGTEVVVLLRAGSAALGLWCHDELVSHKVFKRYVVRGRGKAQALHLKTKGKSRYGSRLRLQNARRLLAEVNERLAGWAEDEGTFDAIFRACPPRLWADLCAAEPTPPFDARDPRVRRIGMHVHEPDFRELLRVRNALCTGHVEHVG